jgi:hypothetical protein
MVTLTGIIVFDRPCGHGYTPEALAREENLFVVAYSSTFGSVSVL